MKILKQSTAVTVKVGPFVDDTDFKTSETALTIQKADVRLSKNGGDFAAANADQGASDAGAPHDEVGIYDISLNTTDTNTLGLLNLVIKESGALHVWDGWAVVPANVYDSIIGGSDLLQVDAQQWLNTALATPDTSGYPKVTVKDGTGTGEIDTASGKISLISGDISAIAAAAMALVEAFLETARAEPGQGAPSATLDFMQKIDYLYKWTRNRRTATGSLQNFYADDGTTVDQKASQSDDGTTYDRAEIVSGP